MDETFKVPIDPLKPFKTSRASKQHPVLSILVQAFSKHPFAKLPFAITISSRGRIKPQLSRHKELARKRDQNEGLVNSDANAYRAD